MKDSRIEYARAVSARTRLEIVMEQVKYARSEVGHTVGANHDACRSIDDAMIGLQVAYAKLNIVIPRIP